MCKVFPSSLGPTAMRWFDRLEEGVRNRGKFPFGALKKEIWIPFRASLFLGKWCGVATYFLSKKKKKN